MLTLCIDTVSEKNMVSLMRDGRQVAKKTWTPNQQESEQLVNMVDGLLKKAKKTWNDCGEIRVHTGPGMFTRVRIGVTTANALAYALDIPLGILGSKKKAAKKSLAPTYGRPPSITRLRRA